MKIEIIPKCNRARNRINEHGKEMFLIKHGQFQGEPAILVESLTNSDSGTKWVGWFTEKEAGFEVT